VTRVALLPSAYPPSLGGVEELTRHLALTLLDAGDEVEVWTGLPDDRRPETVEVRDGIVVRRLPLPLPATNWSSMLRAATTGPRTLFSLRNAADAFRPDVLHVQCFGPNGAYATALARLTRLPLVITLQGETMMDDTDIFEVSTVLRASLRSGIRRAAAVTACSAFTLADAEDRFGLARGRGLVIPNGVDLGAGGAGDDSPAGTPFLPVPGDPGRRYLLALGRVVDKKGFDLLLAAFAAMAPERRTADLVIAGSGPALDGLERMAGELGVGGQVHFVGRLSRDDVASAMAGATAFVMPSRLEPFGIVVLEAWRAGVAVVATNRGGAPEFVDDGETGVLVDPFDTPAFAATLADLLADDGRRLAIGRAGHERVRAYSWPAVTEQYRRLYATVTGVEGQAAGLDAGAHLGRSVA
jgi:glycosyltransferase involved in cell wall biosynthesis